MDKEQATSKMLNRDEYFFDICRDAGLDPSDSRDWVNIGILFSDDRIKSDYEIALEEAK